MNNRTYSPDKQNLFAMSFRVLRLVPSLNTRNDKRRTVVENFQYHFL